MSERPLRDDLASARAVLSDFLGDVEPVAGVILGSGLNPFAEEIESPRFLSYADVPSMKSSTATGHKGRFVLGKLPSTDRWILCMQGRLHGYEGNTAQDVAFPVWLMGSCGITTLVTTNAAGAINPSFAVGSFALMSDHINMTGRNPIVGVEPNAIAERFVPMMDAYDPELRRIARAVAESEGIELNEGVYLGLLGPSFETPAEIKMFASWGADTVAMSVVEEVIAARHIGMRVMGISMISNMACGVGDGDPNSDEVMDVAVTCEERFARLIAGVLARL